MVSRLALGVSVAAAIALAPLAGCGEDRTDANDHASIDAATAGDGQGGASDGAAGDADQPTTRLRLAQLSPDVGRIDVCYRFSPTDAFVGPLLDGGGRKDAGPDVATDAPNDGPSDAAADAKVALDAGAPPGLPFPDVTGYFTIPATGPVELAIVRAADGNCNAPRARKVLSLDPGKLTTVAVVGLFGADAGTAEALDLLPFPDEGSPAAGLARVRFIHAALGSSTKAEGPGPLAASVVTAQGEEPLAARIEPRHASSPSTTDPIVDALGYHARAPLASGALRFVALGASADGGSIGPWSMPTAPIEMSPGTTHTGFLVSRPAGGIAVTWCDDDTATCVAIAP